jgi:hypothetical protein
MKSSCILRPSDAIRGAVGRVSDPDSIRSVDPDTYSESESVFGIRIRIQEGKIIHKSRKNYESSCFEVLDVFFES